MVKRVQHVRHTTANANLYTGNEGEITVDTDRDDIRVHDGAQAGGHRVPNKVANDLLYQPLNTGLTSLAAITAVEGGLIYSDGANSWGQLAIGTAGQILVTDSTADAPEWITNLVMPGTLDMNGLELILDADGDTSIHSDTDDTIDIKIATADDFQFTANTFSVLNGSSIIVDVGGTISIDDTTDSISAVTGSIHTDGGMGIAKDLFIGGSIIIGTADEGIDFSATADITGTTEEVFTGWRGGLHTATLAGSTSGSWTLNSAFDTLAFTEIGQRLVNMHGRLVVTGESSPVGQVRMSIPYTIGALTEAADTSYQPCVLTGHGDPGIENPAFDVASGNTDIGLVNILDDGTVETIDQTRVGTSWTLNVNVWFIRD